jgi:putative ABC transport system permease protein
MGTPADLWRRLKFFFRRGQFDRDLEEEMQHHLAMKAEAHLGRQEGISSGEARNAAHREFGNTLLLREKSRDMWGFRWLETSLQDLRFGVRVLRKSPGFTSVAVLTLALGIGANTAIFSMVDWVIFRLPPVTKPQQVVTLASQDIDGRDYSNEFSYPNFTDIRNQSTAIFSGVAALLQYTMDGLSVGGNDEPMWTNYVTGNFFELMGVKPALGNLIEPDARKSPSDEPVLVLGYSYWKTYFGGDPHVIGKSVLVNGHPVTVIGVAPKGFHGSASFVDVQGYLPLGMAAVTADANKNFAANRKPFLGLFIIARLKRGVTLASAQPALTVVAHRLSAEYPDANKWRSLIASALNPLGPPDNPSAPNPMHLISALFLALAGLVLILACLNIANLLLARASGRQREMAVRAAVGGGRHRLVRQLLTESLLLALLGCAGGIVLGLAGSRWLSTINLKTAIPFVFDFQFDWRVFAYAFGAALLTALLVGIAPALRATQGNLSNLLHESARTTTAGRQRARSVLVIAQVGGSLMLLIIAGLFVRSLRNVEHANLGFDPSNVLNFTVNPHEAGYNQAEARDFLNNLLLRVRALPGTETASLAMTVPMGYYSYGMDLKIEGYPPPAGQRAPSVGYNAISPQYFKTMGISVLRGRGFLDSDVASSQHVADINQTMAEKYWHGENPIGRSFANVADPEQPIKVVGIVKNSRVDSNFSGPIGPYAYFALAQHFDYRIPATLQLRTNLPPAVMNREVVGVIHSLAPEMPVADVQTMTQALYTLDGLLLFQIGAGLAGSLGILGLVLAIVGIYGVVSYSAGQRTHEIGIRLALGAQPSQILRMIFRQGFVVVGAGIVVGVLAAAAIARIAGTFIVGVSPLDAITYFVAAFVLAFVALLACYIPAGRAMRVDPMVALRYE